MIGKTHLEQLESWLEQGQHSKTFLLILVKILQAPGDVNAPPVAGAGSMGKSKKLA